MSIKIKKERLDKKETVRYTSEEFDVISEKAKELGMKPSAYIRDKTINGKERSSYAIKKMITAKITAQKHIDQLYELLETTNSDSVPKENIIQLLEEARKECTVL